MIGQYLGPYEILMKLGEGGMGAVYKARDTRLGRTVALKILPAAMTSSPDRRRRFIQEAQAASALNHANIITIHDISEIGGLHFIVMEYATGKTLDQLIAGRGLPLRQVLRYAIQMAAGLQAAHAAGIVHRDLKPSNVMVSEDGAVKLFDFGLAKLAEIVDSSPDVAASPGDLTSQGMILGTPSYMSPEQAESRKIDARSDIFSFGAVLYEMVTGRKAFEGPSAVSVIASILRDEPKPPSSAESPAPLELEQIISRCLRKDPARRYQNIIDVRTELEALAGHLESPASSGSLAAPPAQPSRTKTLPWIALAVLLLTAGGWLAWKYRSTSPVAPIVVRPFTLLPGAETTPAFSPDGNMVAFSWNGPEESNRDVYVKLIDSGEPLRLTSHPDFDVAPIFSPDGRRIAFSRFNDTPSGFTVGVFVIPALGGTESRIADGWACDWSPDGKSLLVGIMEKGVRVLSLVNLEDGSAVRLPVLAGGLGPTQSAPVGGTVRFSPDGRWLYASAEKSPTETTLHRCKLPDCAWTQVPLEGLLGFASFDLSPDGSELVLMGRSKAQGAVRPYRAPSDGGPAQQLPFGTGGSGVVWARKGDMLAFVSSVRVQALYRVPLPIPAASPVQPERWISGKGVETSPAFSPDGRYLLVSSDRSGASQIYRSDAEGNGATELTKLFGVTVGSPVWSPDGQRIVFDARVEGNPDIWVMNSDGSQPHRLTTEQSEDVTAAWSPDGNSLVFCSNRSGDQQLWRVPAGGGDAVRVTRNGGFAPRLSPDGRYFYYLKSRAAGGVCRMPVSGGLEEDILPSVRDRNWTVTTEGIYAFQMKSGATGLYGTNQPADLLFFDLRTRRLTKTAFTTPRRIGNNGIAVSPGGNYLIYPQFDELGSDIMLVENFR